jgi:hypothetical protein
MGEVMASSAVARGVVFIHSTPKALCTHLEWAIGKLIGNQVQLDWVNQPVAAGSVRSELSWVGKAGLAAQITSTLLSFPNIRFEVTEEPSSGTDGQRFVSTPSLGLWRSPMGVYGEVFVPEDRLRAAVIYATSKGDSIISAIDEVLGTPWDRELEPFRFAGEGVPVRWLHQVG